MAISYVDGAAAEANSVTLPSGLQFGDVMVMFAFRNGSTTAPTVPSGWISVGVNTGTTCSSVVAFRHVATASETSGTWTNATSVLCLVYRGAFVSGTPALNSGGQSGTSPTVNYSGITTMNSPGQAWVLRFAGIASINTTIETPPSGHTFRKGNVGATTELVGFDTNGSVSSSTFGSTSVGGTNGNYITKTIELLEDRSTTGLTAKANQLTGPAAVGTSATTDPGFQPKFIMSWGGLQTANGAVANAQFSLGVATNNQNETSAGFNSADAVAASDVVRYFNTARLGVHFTAGTTTTNNIHELSSFNFDGFTTNWPTLTTVSPLYNYLAIGGKDITGFKTGNFALNTTTGNQSITGIGFQPDFILLFFTLQTTSAQSNNTDQYSLGVADKDGNQWSITQRAQNASATMSTNRSFSNTACLLMTQTAANNIAHKASLVSMDADGFTINNQTSVGLACLVGYAAFKGGTWKVGTETQNTTTGTKTTALPFSPKGVIFAGVCDTTTNDAVSNNARLFVGASTGSSNNVSTWTGDANGTADAVANTIMRNNKAIVMATEGTSATPTVNAEAAVTSLSNGFTLDWTTADSTARTFGYVAFGDTATTPPPVGDRASDFFMFM